MSSVDSQEQPHTEPDGTPDTEEFVVFVPLANPETETHLITIGSAVANQRDGRVVAAIVVQVPDQTSLEAARDRFDYRDSKDLLEGARRTASDVGASIETHTVFSHNLFRTVFDAAKQYDTDLCVMGWGANSPGCCTTSNVRCSSPSGQLDVGSSNGSSVVDSRSEVDIQYEP